MLANLSAWVKKQRTREALNVGIIKLNVPKKIHSDGTIRSVRQRSNNGPDFRCNKIPLLIRRNFGHELQLRRNDQEVKAL